MMWIFILGIWSSLAGADFIPLQSPGYQNTPNLIKRDSNYTIPLGRNLSNIVLFQTNNVEIQCTQCYIAGTASIGLAIDNNFNFTQVFDNLKSNVSAQIKNITEETAGQVLQVYSGQQQGLDFKSFGDLDLPTIVSNFTLTNVSIPEVHLDFRFDGLEVYMALDTILSTGTSYTLNLYASKSAVGIKINQNLAVGLYASVDLILDASSQIDISSGFHIKMDDGVSFNIALFAKEVSKMNMPGGQFEFLPVTLKSGSTTLSATLQISIHAGINFDLPTSALNYMTVFGEKLPLPSAGLDVAVYANVAEFKTNVTYNSANTSCQLAIEESYQFALGAQAGATVGFGDIFWGPTPETSTPVFYTTLGLACALTKNETFTSSTTSSTQTSIAKRQNLQTTTAVETVVYTAVACKSQGLVPCPASLQTTTKVTTTTALVTVLPSGSSLSPPAVTQTAISMIPFGKAVNSIIATSGKPVSYIPPPLPPPPNTTTSSASNATHTAGANIHKVTDAMRTKKLIIGLSVGLGVPFLTIIGVVAFVLIKKKQKSYRFAPTSEPLPHIEVLGPSRPYRAYKAPLVTVGDNGAY